MKFYLSSYKLGDKKEELKKLTSNLNKKTAYISNALDFSNDTKRRQISEQVDIDDLKNLGLHVEKLDLRKYFNKKEELERKISEYGVVWVRGGNCFVLRQAMKISGFDIILHSLRNREDFLYGAYSAGVCVLGPSLKGFDIIDDSSIFPYKEIKEQIISGVGIINYSVIPHYDSDHPESNNTKKVVAFMIQNKLPFIVLRDGEVIIQK